MAAADAVGVFEGRLDYGPQMQGFPLWMRIQSRPVKLAFTFAFIYVPIVALQTLHFSLGPVDPTPPVSFRWSSARCGSRCSRPAFFPFYLMAAAA